MDIRVEVEEVSPSLGWRTQAIIGSDTNRRGGRVSTPLAQITIHGYPLMIV